MPISQANQTRLVPVIRTQKHKKTPGLVSRQILVLSVYVVCHLYLSNNVVFDRLCQYNRLDLGFSFRV